MSSQVFESGSACVELFKTKPEAVQTQLWLVAGLKKGNSQAEPLLLVSYRTLATCMLSQKWHELAF